MRKRMIAVMMTCLIMAAAAGCSSNGSSNVSSGNTSAVSGTAETSQMPNPWEDFKSLEEAEQYAGVTVSLPDALDGFTLSDYRAMDGLIEAHYADENGNELIIRKGTGDSEISGDYNDYAYTHNTSDDPDDLGGGVLNSCTDLIYRGNSSDDIKAVTWGLDGMQYAIGVETQSLNISESDMSSYVTNIVEMNLGETEVGSDTSATAASAYDKDWNAEESILQEILGDVESGSAGSSLKAEIAAADALNWAAETSLSAQEIKSIASDWKEKLSSEELSAYQSSFDAVLEMAEKAVNGDEDTLTSMKDDAGIGVNTELWTKDALALVEALK